MKAGSAAVSLLLLATPVLARDPSRIAPAAAPSSSAVAPAGEPGERLEVRGVVYAADGRTPVPSASLYVYQTDARGYYRPDDPGGNRDPRLHALLRTDAAGRYSFTTVRPGSYPGTRVPQHIHYEVAADGHGSRIFEIVFEDDPNVTDEVRRRARQPASVYSLRSVARGPGGISLVEQDVVLGPAPTAEWPSFRGPGARGFADGQGLPREWDVRTGRNVRWKTAVPGLGHSSPIVWGDRLFVTSALGAGQGKVVPGDEGGIELADETGALSWRLTCLSALDGRVVWSTEAFAGPPRAKRHVKASQANATPVTDGRTVVALFGSEGAAAFDWGGRLLWKADLGVLNPGLLGDSSSEWGHASSPVIAGDRVIVQVDRHAGSFLAALDLATGRRLWTVPRDERPVWATPLLHQAAGRTEVVVVGGLHVRAYDPADGRELWRFRDEAEVKTPSPFAVDGLIVLAGGYRGRPIYALRDGATGDVSVPEGAASGPFLAWRTEPGGPYTSTPVAYRGRLYAVRDEGVFMAHDLKTGALVYRERTGATHSASPVASDGRLYVATEGGEVLVLGTGDGFEVLARNDMGEPIFATPAIARGTLYVRTRGHVYALAAS